MPDQGCQAPQRNAWHAEPRTPYDGRRTSCQPADHMRFIAGGALRARERATRWETQFDRGWRHAGACMRHTITSVVTPWLRSRLAGERKVPGQHGLRRAADVNGRVPGCAFGSPGAGRLGNGRLPENSAMTPTGSCWPITEVRDRPLFSPGDWYAFSIGMPFPNELLHLHRELATQKAFRCESSLELYGPPCEPSRLGTKARGS